MERPWVRRRSTIQLYESRKRLLQNRNTPVAMALQQIKRICLKLRLFGVVGCPSENAPARDLLRQAR
jgi:hypothetical protein